MKKNPVARLECGSTAGFPLLSQRGRPAWHRKLCGKALRGDGEQALTEAEAQAKGRLPSLLVEGLPATG